MQTYAKGVNDLDEALLKCKNVTKRFGGLEALSDVSFDLNEGEILGLIGPNGAGKTTMFNVIAGFSSATSGDVIYCGKNINGLKAFRRCEHGIARTFQITKPFENITVVENVMIGAFFGKRHTHKTLADAAKEADELLEFTELTHKRLNLAGTLNVSERKRLEFARALATHPKVLLLDEVIAGLNPTGVSEMMQLIQKVNKREITILMIEHVMKAVMGISNRIIVLSFGKKLAEGTPEQISKNPAVISAYLGGGVTHAES